MHFPNSYTSGAILKDVTNFKKIITPLPISYGDANYFKSEVNSVNGRVFSSHSEMEHPTRFIRVHWSSATLHFRSYFLLTWGLDPYSLVTISRTPRYSIILGG